VIFQLTEIVTVNNHYQLSATEIEVAEKKKNTIVHSQSNRPCIYALALKWSIVMLYGSIGLL